MMAEVAQVWRIEAAVLVCMLCHLCHHLDELLQLHLQLSGISLLKGGGGDGAVMVR